MTIASIGFAPGSEAAAQERDQRDLYVLSVGVEPELTARASWDPYSRDARYVAELFTAESTPYASPIVRVISGADATRANVLDGLRWLAESARPQDVALAFFSTHGDVDRSGRYAVSLAVDEEGSESGAHPELWGRELTDELARVRGLPILLLDTCQSGGVLTTRPERLAVIGASAANEDSDGQWQRPDRPHGWFVMALHEALTGRADADADRAVTLGELAEYLPGRARELNPKQNAVATLPAAMRELALTRVAASPPPPLWPVVEQGPPRNPFGVADVPCPEGEDVQALARQARLEGDRSDPNARRWPARRIQGGSASLIGAWSGRWRYGTRGRWRSGQAELRTVDDRVFLLFDDAYLIEARRTGDGGLMGRYVNLSNATDTSPWVGRIVSPGRIDGAWSGGRWDFRRHLNDAALAESPEARSAAPGLDEIFAAFDSPGSPGCAVAIARDGELIHARGYGYANLEHAVPASSTTAFDVGSVTKQFTAACACLLALEGRLSLDDDVRVWLPELPEYERPITLRHLLHHTSGLRDYLNLLPLAGRSERSPISRLRILEMMARQEALVSPPGERYRYSNTGYMLLAHAVERAAGMSLGELARERLFEPLGMSASFLYEDSREILPGRATGYDWDSEGRVRVVHNQNFDVVGDGQMYSTVEDLLRWNEYLHGELAPELRELMLTEGRLANGEALGYGLGLALYEHRGARVVGHGGSSWGFRTQLVRFVDHDLAIAIASNSDDADPWSLVERVAEHYLGDALAPAEDEPAWSAEEPAPPPASDAPPVDLRRFEGEFYAPELDATYRFFLREEALFVRIEQEPALPVSAETPGRLVLRFDPEGSVWASPASLEPQRAEDDELTGFLLSSGTERGIRLVRR
ncbi:MAG: serine hydrolase [Planctomycetota bacterium]